MQPVSFKAIKKVKIYYSQEVNHKGCTFNFDSLDFEALWKIYLNDHI